MGVGLRCNQCEMISINGVACHERGCPNNRPKRKCEVCGYDVDEECPEDHLDCFRSTPISDRELEEMGQELSEDANYNWYGTLQEDTEEDDSYYLGKVIRL